MKIGNFVQTIVDIQDLLSYFANVKTKDQMISALERIKKQEVDGFLDTITSMQNSFETITSDDIETPNGDEIEALFSGGDETTPTETDPKAKSDEETPASTSAAAERLGI